MADHVDASDPLGDMLRLISRLEACLGPVREVLEAVAQGRSFDADRLLRSRPSLFAELDSLMAQLTDSLMWQGVQEEIELRRDTARLDLPAILEAAFAEKGLRWTGSFPKYRLSNNVRVDIDPIKGQVAVGGSKQPFIDPEEIVAAAARASARRVRQPVPTADLLGRLLQAYRAALATAGKADGSYLPIGKIHDAIRPLMPKGYSRTRFGQDLAELLASANSSVEVAPPRIARQGLKLGNGMVVGSLRVREG